MSHHITPVTPACALLPVLIYIWAVKSLTTTPDLPRQFRICSTAWITLGLLYFDIFHIYLAINLANLFWILLFSSAICNFILQISNCQQKNLTLTLIKSLLFSDAIIIFAYRVTVGLLFLHKFA